MAAVVEVDVVVFVAEFVAHRVVDGERAQRGVVGIDPANVDARKRVMPAGCNQDDGIVGKAFEKFERLGGYTASADQVGIGHHQREDVA